MADSTHSRTLSIEKYVLVIGESGVGKSRIVNMLYNQDTSVDCCTTPCLTGATGASVTKRSSLHANLRSGWVFMDTMGVGDPNLSSGELLRAIRSVVGQTVRGIHCVVAVMKMGRVPQASRANVDLLCQLFHENDLRSHGVLVLTHWEGELGNEEADLREWAGSDEFLLWVIGTFSKIVLTNNQVTGRGVNPECRQKCLREVNEAITLVHTPILAKPVNIMELFHYIVKKYFHWLRNGTHDFREFLFAIHEQTPLPTYCGDCAVCLDEIEAYDVCVLKCNHIFHRDCVAQLTVLECPLCRVAFQSGTWWSFQERREHGLSESIV